MTDGELKISTICLFYLLMFNILAFDSFKTF